MQQMAYRRIGASVVACRNRIGMIQAQVADRAGISRGQLANIESGRYGFSIHTLKAIAQVLRVKVWEILKTADL